MDISRSSSAGSMWPIRGSSFEQSGTFGVEIFAVRFGDAKVSSRGTGWVLEGQLEWLRCLNTPARGWCWVG